MSFDAWLTVIVVAAVFALLATGRYPPHLILLGGLGVVVVSGVVDPASAVAGFGNEGLITVAVLFVVAAGLRQTGAMAAFVHRALGRPKTSFSARARMAPPVVVASAFLNNTPLVAMLMPVVLDWCKANRIAPSKLLLPLSYLAILGGLCTLIGTSTNLVVNGLYLEAGGTGFSIFDVSVVGVPCALVGTGLLLGLGDALLPSRTAAVVIPTDPKEFTVEMKVAKGGVLVGQTIEAAGLRHLPGLYLMEIHRNDRVFAAVEPHEVLEADDQLVFVGVVESVVDLQRIPGLAVATHQVFKLDGARAERCFAQAVVSRACPLVGETIRAGRFRNRYGAVVIAVSRAGQRVPGRIGDIELHVGDVLLLEAPPTFVEQQRNSKDFYLVSRLDTEGPPTTTRAGVAAVILLAMVGLAASGLVSMMQAAFLAAAAMFLSRCVSEESARRSVDWPLLLSIGCAFGLGKALEQSGVASRFAELLLAQAGAEPMVALVVIYATTVLVSELVTNNAAAVIVFPIAVSTAVALGVESRPFVVAVMMAASAAFATPLGYQTHLMVYGPGGYRLGDFLKIGIPMNLAVGATACFLIPRFFPF